MAAAWDHIVIGAGAGGSAVAGRLAQAGRRVLVLEAGCKGASPLLRVPGLVAFGSSDARFNWADTTAPQPRLEGRKLYQAAGRVLGGGSAINGMVYSRGFARDYADWGVQGWEADTLLPHFKRSERNHRGDTPLHGGSGPIAVSRGVSDLPICDLILEAAGETGFARSNDFCATEDESFGYYDLTIDKGRRADAARGYLGLAEGRVTVRTGVTVTRLRIAGGRVAGVAYLQDGAADEVTCDSDVILAAGAINSAQILLLSGVGPADDLRALDMPVVLDQPHVGRHLQNHLCFKLAYTTWAGLTAYGLLNPLRGAAAVGRYVTGKEGFFAHGLSPVGGFFKSLPELDAPDMQVFAPPGLQGLKGTGLRAKLPSCDGFSFFVSLGRPASRGRVGLVSADPLARPCIDPDYLSDPQDMARLVAGIARIRDLARAPALAGVITGLCAPQDLGGRPDDIAAAVRRGVTQQFHPTSTCRMAADPAAGVVAPDLAVHGIAGLRIADTSIMPGIVNGNTNAIAMMIGERAADFILAA